MTKNRGGNWTVADEARQEVNIPFPMNSSGIGPCETCIRAEDFGYPDEPTVACGLVRDEHDDLMLCDRIKGCGLWKPRA